MMQVGLPPKIPANPVCADARRAHEAGGEKEAEGVFRSRAVARAENIARGLSSTIRDGIDRISATRF